MGMKHLAAAAAVLLLFASATSASVTTPQPDTDSPSAAATDALRRVQRAFDDVRQGNTAAAGAGLDKAMQAPGFKDLPEDVRFQTINMAALVAWDANDYDKAHTLAAQSTAFPEADSAAWMVRFASAFGTGHYTDAAHSLTMYAQRWPAKLDQIVPGAVFQLHYRLQLAHQAEPDRKMLDELFDAHWQDNGVEPSVLWRDLALAHLQRGETARATEVALRVTSAEVALSMLVDKRFDSITGKHADAFNVDRLLAAEIKAAEARKQAHPDQLQPVTDLLELYLAAGEPKKVLAASDTIVRLAERREGPKTYSDFADHYNWLLDLRSRAWKRQGEWDKAVALQKVGRVERFNIAPSLR